MMKTYFPVYHRKRNIQKIITELKDNKAPGYFKITAKIVKQNEDKITPILVKLTNDTIKTSEYLIILKKNSRIDLQDIDKLLKPENYKPNCIPNCLNKIHVNSTISTSRDLEKKSRLDRLYCAVSIFL